MSVASLIFFSAITIAPSTIINAKGLTASLAIVINIFFPAATAPLPNSLKDMDAKTLATETPLAAANAFNWDILSPYIATEAKLADLPIRIWAVFTKPRVLILVIKTGINFVLVTRAAFISKAID